MIGKTGLWGAVTASGGALICATALTGWWMMRAPQLYPTTERPQQSPASLGDLKQALSPAPQLSPPVANPPSSSMSGPRVDVARVTPEGDALIAGRTEPGASVALLDGGKTLLETKADPTTGEFVLLPPRLAPGEHKLSLRSSTTPGAAEAQESEVLAFSVSPSGKIANAANSSSRRKPRDAAGDDRQRNDRAGRHALAHQP